MKRARDSKTPTNGVAKRSASEKSCEPSEEKICNKNVISSMLEDTDSNETSSNPDLTDTVNLGGRSDGESSKQATNEKDCDMASDHGKPEHSSEKENLTEEESDENKDTDWEDEDNGSFRYSSDGEWPTSPPFPEEEESGTSNEESDESSNPDLESEDDSTSDIVNWNGPQHLTSSSWEGPARFLPDLTRLRQRQSYENNLQPLSHLALRCVSCNWKYFSELSEPFGGLPGSILESLVRFLEAEDKLDCPTVLPLVVTERSRYISVNCLKVPKFDGDHSSVFFTEDFSNIFRKISSLCKESMQVLRLRVDHRSFLQAARDPYPSLLDLNETLARMTNLTELCLHFGNITNQTVIVLAKHCRQLKVLDLDDNGGVTDGAITYLCGFGDAHEQQGCCELQRLSLNDTGVTKAGLVLALERLPELTELKHAKTTSAILEFVSNSLFNIRARLQLEEYTSNTKHLEKQESVCKVLKNLKSFIFYYNKINIRSSLREIAVQNAISKILNVITMFGSKLTKVELKIPKLKFDVSVIAHNCPNIEVFKYETNERLDHDSYALLPTHFQKLREIHLSVGGTSDAFPEAVLERMLSSPVLEKIILMHYILTNNVLAPLIEEAKINEIVFAKLTHVNISSCNLDFEKLKEMICVAPNLKSITTFGCRHREPWVHLGDTVGNFITRNRLSHIHLVWH